MLLDAAGFTHTQTYIYIHKYYCVILQGMGHLNVFVKMKHILINNT